MESPNLNERQKKIEAGKEKFAAYLRKKERRKLDGSESESGGSSLEMSHNLSDHSLKENEDYKNTINVLVPSPLHSNKNDNDGMSSPIEEEIEEVLSVTISHESNSDSDGNDPNGDNVLRNKTRQLFDLDNDMMMNQIISGPSQRFLFDDNNLDDLLSGDNIAQHFQPPSTNEEEEDGDKSYRDKSLEKSNKSNDNDNEIDSLDQALNELDSLSEKENKELTDKNEKLEGKDHSPGQSSLRESSPNDVILINDQKISIKSLTKKQQQLQGSQEGSFTNQSTTNDISDLMKDENSSLKFDGNNSGSLKQTRSLDNTKIHPNITLRDCRSLDISVDLFGIKNDNVLELSKKDDDNDSPNDSIEEDKSVEEVIVSNNSIECSLNADELSSLGPGIDINNKEEMDKILDHHNEDDDDDIVNLREKLEDVNVISQTGSATNNIQAQQQTTDLDSDEIVVKPMERVLEFSKEVLEDISEESERALESLESISKLQVYTINKTNDGEEKNINEAIEKGREFRQLLSISDNVLKKTMSNSSFFDPTDEMIKTEKEEAGLSLPIIQTTSQDFDSVISLNMLQSLEGKVKELQDVIAGKDIVVAALNMQLEAYSRRDSLKELPPSGRDSSSLATNSTEYRTIQDEYLNKVFDIQGELTERDHLIEQLTDSLQQSMQVREQLQIQGEKLTSEVFQLRKQLTETLEMIKKPHWMRDQESVGQRLSEISIDLVSETDEESEKNLTDAENKSNRDSKERQLFDNNNLEYFDQQQLLFMPISKQIEQFQKYLSPDELRIFFMIQKKFDDYLSQEVEKVKIKHDSEIKLIADRMETEKNEMQSEMNRLRQLLTSVKSGSTEILELRHELEMKHSQEMENLRTYFERKCADLEKHYSEDVFSQKSQRNSNDTSSDLSDQEHLLSDHHHHHQNIKKKSKSDIYSSPTHRKMTPTTIDSVKSYSKKTKSLSPRLGLQDDTAMSGDDDPAPMIDELKLFYQEKINEINRNHREIVRILKDKLKRYEDKYADDEFMSNEAINNEPNELNQILAEYDRRLQEQVALAREDILHELEKHIQALLSESAEEEDSHWPPELILLREKFTAKSQLEIAQLQIKHEEEMSRLKTDFDKQISRKVKRHTTFDSNRDLDEIVIERDNLRELSNTLRRVLAELAKYCSICEDDFNQTFVEELQKYGFGRENDTTIQLEDETGAGDGQTLLLNSSIDNKRKVKFSLDVTGILSLVEDESLIEFISQPRESIDSKFNLENCLDLLKTEVSYILKLSNELQKKDKTDGKSSEKGDSCEEEDGLKSGTIKRRQKITKTSSLTEALPNGDPKDKDNESPESGTQKAQSLPIMKSFSRQNSITNFCGIDDVEFLNQSELNVQLHDLKNRLLKSEDDRKHLEEELARAVSQHDSLVQELSATKEHIEVLEGQREIFSEGFGSSPVSPIHQNVNRSSTSLMELQEKAKHILHAPPDVTNENATLLLQLIEDFCREGDRCMDERRKDKTDLQAQQRQFKTSTNGHSEICDKIDAADKQLKATRQFLEEQAAEREQERDDFTKEIEKLKAQLRERDKERSSHERLTKEIDAMELQIKELTNYVNDTEEKKQKMETELKASIDKIFVLREIIAELELQIEKKTLNEHCLKEKLKELETYIGTQSRANESLQNEVESLKYEMDGKGYTEKINQLVEEQLKNLRPSVEQSLILEQLTIQLRDIENVLDRKTKTLESLHATLCSTSCSSPSEDVSVKGQSPSATGTNNDQNVEEISPRSVQPISLPIDEVQRIMEKLAKHNRAEEAAIKRIKDLEMQINGVRSNCAELQHERDVLQERMSEQLLRISSLQSRLDEQRHRAEELHRQGTSDLTIRVHDLQMEVTNLKETLSSRDKQINNLKNHLEQSKQIIDRQENELAMMVQQSDRSQVEKLETELKTKSEENQKLKEKIKNEMINKLALPDLMETMLADKNDEIDHLREILDSKEQQLQVYLSLNLNENQLQDLQKGNNTEQEGKLSARTLSDVLSISDYDDPDLIRKSADTKEGDHFNISAGRLQREPIESTKIFTNISAIPQNKTNETSLFAIPHTSDLIENANRQAHHNDLSVFPKDVFTLTPEVAPRQINFSLVTDESTAVDRKLKDNGVTMSPATIEEVNEHELEKLREKIEKIPQLETEVENLKLSLDSVASEKNSIIEKLRQEVKSRIEEISNLQVELAAKTKLYDVIVEDKKALQEEIYESKLNLIRLQQFEETMMQKQEEIKMSIEKIANLEGIVKEKGNEIDQLEATIMTKSKEYDDLLQEYQNYQNDVFTRQTEEDNQQIFLFKQQIDSLKDTLCHKDELLSKLEKDNINYSRNEQEFLNQIKVLEESKKQKDNHADNKLLLTQLSEELQITKEELAEKMLSHEKCKLDLEEAHLELTKLSDIIRLQQSGDLKEMAIKLQDELSRNNKLLSEIEKLKTMIQRSENSSSPKPFSVDEIAEQVEKELNYSAQLDSNILKAIESDEINSDDDDANDLAETGRHERRDVEELFRQSDTIEEEFKELKESFENEARKNNELLRKNNEFNEQLNNLKMKLENEKENCARLQMLLETEKKNSTSIQQQDADIIDAIRLRLEAALENELELQKMLEEEKNKTTKLSSQMSLIQRSKSRESIHMLKSPNDSPRKSPKISDLESEHVHRLESELKLLTSQNERERERVMDLQRVLERERNRFDKEVTDRKEYGEHISKEMDRVIKEKEQLQEELEQSQEKLSVASREIESLEARILNLQDTEARRVARRGRERFESTQNSLEIQELKTRLISFEKERDQLQEQVFLLRGDLERGAQREVKLAEALTKDGILDGAVPEQFLQKLKEMNNLLAENSKENRQMAETLQFLTEERRGLQKRVHELEINSGNNNKEELEERANHLFGKYLRVESFRKALVHQKRYLLIALASYQENEANALALIQGKNPSTSQPKKKRKSFRTYALIVVAIERMKFIVRRWQSGKRVGAKAIFSSSHHHLPRRSASASTNNWTYVGGDHNFISSHHQQQHPQSPPCRDQRLSTNNFLNNLRPLQAPSLISEYTDGLNGQKLLFRKD